MVEDVEVQSGLTCHGSRAEPTTGRATTSPVQRANGAHADNGMSMALRRIPCGMTWSAFHSTTSPRFVDGRKTARIPRKPAAHAPPDLGRGGDTDDNVRVCLRGGFHTARGPPEISGFHLVEHDIAADHRRDTHPLAPSLLARRPLSGRRLRPQPRDASHGARSCRHCVLIMYTNRIQHIN